MSVNDPPKLTKNSLRPLALPSFNPSGSQSSSEGSIEWFSHGDSADQSHDSQNGSVFRCPWEPKRLLWARKIDFILAVMGFNIGFGNMLRFPYICLKNGGGTFLIPYFIFLLIFGTPLFMLELGLGQYSGLSPIVFWKKLCPLFKGIGWCYVTYSGVFNVYYNLQMSWAFNFFIYSFMSPLPWSSCNNNWNTPRCVNSKNASGLSSNRTTFSCSDYDRISAAEEFWENQVIIISKGIGDMGNVSWSLILGLITTWALIYACVSKGIHSLGKVIYITVVGPYVLLLILVIRGLFLPGGKKGIDYYVHVDWDSLRKSNVWLQAALQIFWSLAPCWGITISMASHNKFFNNIYHDAIVLPLVSGLSSFYAGFVTFAYVGTLSEQLGTPIECVMKQGPGLAFIVYPEALAGMSVSQLWSVLFFFLLILLGLDSAFASFETVCHCLIELYPLSLRKHEKVTRLILAVVTFALSLPMTTSAGQYIYQVIDWYQISLFMFVALTEVIGFAYCYGCDRIRENILVMTKINITHFWTILWMGVLPIILLWLQIKMFLDFAPVTYGSYKYPPLAISLGWVLAVISMLPLPLMAIHELSMTIWKYRETPAVDRQPILQMLRSTIRTSDDWEANAIFNIRNASMAVDSHTLYGN